MQQTASDRDDGPDDTFCSSVGLMCIWYCDLLLNYFILIKHLKRVGGKFTRSIAANELDLFGKLSLDLDDVIPDAVFALGRGTQIETLHAPAGFFND